MMALILFGSLVVFLALGIPIAASIGFAAIVGFAVTGVDLMAVAQRMIASVNTFTLLAIPFFMLAGALMETGGMSRRLVRFANSIVSPLAGGLAHVQVLGSCFFAALSGSSPATTAAIGGALIPEMKKRGYPPEFAAAIQSVSGTVGTIIPPSIPMVVYAVCANQSIGKMFAAGFIPGALYGLALMAVVYYKSRRYGYGERQEFSWQELWASFKESVWALLVPGIILGGIYSGVFTPTEAGAVAAVYGLLVGVFVYKELNMSNIMSVFTKAAANTAMVLLIIASSAAFSWIMTAKGVGAMVGSWFARVAGTPLVFLMMVNVLWLFLGCFMETVSIILIVTPVLFPVAMKLGIDPIHFGIIMTMNLSLGMSTPPVGENLYIASGIAGISFEEICKNVLPFIFAAITVILLTTYIPSLAMFIPNLIYR